MMWDDIKERRRAVKEHVEAGGKIDERSLQPIAKQFGTTTTAIRNDAHKLFGPKPPPGTPAHPSPKMKEYIRERDGGICQYCGATDGLPVIEHVLPRYEGGPATEYNLVMACAGCNTRKTTKPMLPRNFRAITEGHPEWRQHVLDYVARVRAKSNVRLVLKGDEADLLYRVFREHVERTGEGTELLQRMEQTGLWVT